MTKDYIILSAIVLGWLFHFIAIVVFIVSQEKYRYENQRKQAMLLRVFLSELNNPFN